MKLIRKIACALFGHQSRMHQKLSPSSQRIVCARCGGDWAINYDERVIVPWSSEFARFYEDRGVVIRPVASPTLNT